MNNSRPGQAGWVQIDARRQNAGSPLWLRPGQTPGHERYQSGESWEHLWLVLCATQAALPALSNSYMPAGATTLTQADPTQASLGCLACPFLSSSTLLQLEFVPLLSLSCGPAWAHTHKELPPGSTGLPPSSHATGQSGLLSTLGLQGPCGEAWVRRDRPRWPTAGLCVRAF